MAFKVYLSPPNMGGDEIKYVREAFNSNWIAPYGPFLTKFEEEMSSYVGVESALAVSSGTAGLHLALRYLNVKAGDFVFCSNLTFIGSCNPVIYQGAIPVFIDSEPDSWNMSPVALSKAFEWAVKNDKLPKAVIIVDLYGESADYDELLPICSKYNVPVIEDAAEAVGSYYKGKKCGSFGDIAVFSFNGNKIMTTSGGGMILSNDRVAIEKMRYYATQAREPYLYYEHKEIGYNYRMSNICAAIGRGQLQFLDKKIALRKEISKRYITNFSDLPVKIKAPTEKGESNYWLSIMVLDDQLIKPEMVVRVLQNEEIEARPAWKPMNRQPIFEGSKSFSHYDNEYISYILFEHCVCLPSGDGMTVEQQQQVIDAVRNCFTKNRGWKNV